MKICVSSSPEISHNLLIRTQSGTESICSVEKNLGLRVYIAYGQKGFLCLGRQTGFGIFSLFSAYDEADFFRSRKFSILLEPSGREVYCSFAQLFIGAKDYDLGLSFFFSIPGGGKISGSDIPN